MSESRSLELIADDDLEIALGGAQRVASAASRNGAADAAVEDIEDALKSLEQGQGGMNPMMMMMMMMMMNKNSGPSLRTGGLLGGTTVG